MFKDAIKLFEVQWLLACLLLPVVANAAVWIIAKQMPNLSRVALACTVLMYPVTLVVSVLAAVSDHIGFVYYSWGFPAILTILWAVLESVLLDLRCAVEA